MMKNFKCSNVVVAVLASTLLFAGCQSEEDAVAPVAEDQAVSANAAQELPLPVAESAENLRTASIASAETNGACGRVITPITNIPLGGEPKLRPVGYGTAAYGSSSNDCDYYVRFPNNAYTHVVLTYFPNDPQENVGIKSIDVARRIQNLIFYPPTRAFGRITGGGFNNGIGKGQWFNRQGDTSIYLIFGEGRSDAQLLSLANNRGTTVGALLAKYIRMGYY